MRLDKTVAASRGNREMHLRGRRLKQADVAGFDAAVRPLQTKVLGVPAQPLPAAGAQTVAVRQIRSDTQRAERCLQQADAIKPGLRIAPVQAKWTTDQRLGSTGEIRTGWATRHAAIHTDAEG